MDSSTVLQPTQPPPPISSPFRSDPEEQHLTSNHLLADPQRSLADGTLLSLVSSSRWNGLHWETVLPAGNKYSTRLYGKCCFATIDRRIWRANHQSWGTNGVVLRSGERTCRSETSLSERASSDASLCVRLGFLEGKCNHICHRAFLLCREADCDSRTSFGTVAIRRLGSPRGRLKYTSGL